MNVTDKIESLIHEYGNDVLKIAFLYMKDKALAEDVFQDVFIKAYEKWDLFHGKSSEKTWLVRIAINTCKDYLKSAYGKKVLTVEEVENWNADEDVEEKVAKREEKSKMIDLIMSLPHKYKDVLILYYYQDFTTIEIAKILTIPEATVRTRMKRARAMLKENIEG